KFIDRNLNDTRYIARFLSNYIQENLLLVGKNKKNALHQTVKLLHY
ncbi:hypothetical protein AAUPMB_11831, partial [Pasteurella multocida subsp. multocida str. Anand1_buffalo]